VQLPSFSTGQTFLRSPASKPKEVAKAATPASVGSTRANFKKTSSGKSYGRGFSEQSTGTTAATSILRVGSSPAVYITTWRTAYPAGWRTPWKTTSAFLC